MRNRLGVSRGLELAHGLAGAISEFAEREEAIAKERRTKSFAAKRALEQLTKADLQQVRPEEHLPLLGRHSATDQRGVRQGSPVRICRGRGSSMPSTSVSFARFSVER